MIWHKSSAKSPVMDVEDNAIGGNNQLTAYHVNIPKNKMIFVKITILEEWLSTLLYSN